MNKVTIEIDNCVDCEQHEVLPDLDPHDWFCDDDVKVICKLTSKNITSACRLYNKRKECGARLVSTSKKILII